MSSYRPFPARAHARLAAAALAAGSVLLAMAPSHASTPAPVGSLPSLSAQAGAGAADRGPWHTLGKLYDGSKYGWPVIAGSPRGHWVSTAQRQSRTTPRPENIMVRGDRHGIVSRTTYPVGLPWAAWVGPTGNAVVVSESKSGTLRAVSWRHDRKRPSTYVLAEAGRLPGLLGAELLVNSAGDLTVYGTFDVDRMFVIRRPAGGRWERPLTIAPGRYDAAMTDVGMDGKGRVTGAFLVDHTVSLRALAPDSRQFGPAKQVISWPEIEDWPRAYVEYATVDVGVDGDKVASLAYGNWNADGPAYGRAVLMPKGEPRWRVEWEDGSFDRAVVGADGAVTVPIGLEVRRWTPDTRTVRTLDSTWFKTANPRGDVLLGTAAYRGRLFVWPDGRGPLPGVDSAPGYTRATALAGATVYAAVSRRGSGDYVMERARLGR